MHRDGRERKTKLHASASESCVREKKRNSASTPLRDVEKRGGGKFDAYDTCSRIERKKRKNAAGGVGGDLFLFFGKEGEGDASRWRS